MADALTAAFKLARGEFAVDIDVAFPPGITCVMGPSGGGKSTLLGVLAGLVMPDTGRVTLGDEVWLDRKLGVVRPVHARRLSFVFQGLALFPHMTAQKNVEYGIAELPPADRAEKAKALLEKLGVAHLAHRRPRTFSGGEAQRVALARAFARSPRVLLLDEPYSALDRDLRAQLVALERTLAAELAVPVIHVTHSVAEAKLLADRVVRIERGSVVEQGAPSAVLAHVVD